MGVYNVIIISILFFLPKIKGFPDQGIWSKTDEKVRFTFFGAHKSLYGGSSISMSVNCEPYQSRDNGRTYIEIGWVLRQTSCFEEYLSVDIMSTDTLRMMYDCPMNTNGIAKVRYKRNKPLIVECSSAIHLEYTNETFVDDNKYPSEKSVDRACQINYAKEMVDEKSEYKSLVNIKVPEEEKKTSFDNKLRKINENISKLDQNDVPDHNVRKRDSTAKEVKSNQNSTQKLTPHLDLKKSKDSDNVEINAPIINEMLASSYNATSPYHDMHSNVKKSGLKITTVDVDGVYLFVLKLQSVDESLVNLTIDVSIKGAYGYLSAADYPLFLFYGYMCGVYVIYAISWLIVSALQWRDLLRIQFWIGAVIVLGLSEKAVFYAEYHSINLTGESVQGAVIFAEILSCFKRTLARMLVIIVSLGFGIVKPRLGPMLHRVVGVGALYFVLGATEGCLRVVKPKNDPSNQALMAGVPLAVTDSVICWWIFSSLVQTNRTLRLRRNLVKLSLYRHFTNTLIFAVLASITYMIWSIHSHKLVTCVTDWKELWVDEAYWHLLFSLILLVIMILWRPTNNNQRYAYTPLLDALDDDNEDDFEQSLSNDAFTGMKMRASKNLTPTATDKEIDEKVDDDLKWVEENVPSTFTESAVPTFLDSDEEIMTAKFERNKME